MAATGISGAKDQNRWFGLHGLLFRMVPPSNIPALARNGKPRRRQLLPLLGRAGKAKEHSGGQRQERAPTTAPDSWRRRKLGRRTLLQARLPNQSRSRR